MQNLYDDGEFIKYPGNYLVSKKANGILDIIVFDSVPTSQAGPAGTMITRRLEFPIPFYSNNENELNMNTAVSFSFYGNKPQFLFSHWMRSCTTVDIYIELRFSGLVGPYIARFTGRWK